MNNGRVPTNFGKRIFRPLTPPLLLLLLTVVALTITSSLAAAKPVLIDEAKQYRLSTTSYLFDDPDLTWRQVANADLNERRANGDIQLDLHAAHLPVWVRVDIAVGDVSTQDWLFDVGNLFGGRLDFYQISEGSLIQHYEVDSFKSFHTRPYNHRQTKFPIVLHTKTTNTLILRIEKTDGLPFRSSIIPAIKFTASDSKIILFLGLHYGLILSLMVYHLLLAIVTLDRNYLLYSIYLAAYSLVAFSYSGLGFQYLWPDAPWFQIKIATAYSFSSTVFAVLFTISFLNLYKLSRAITIAFIVPTIMGVAYTLLRSLDLIPNLGGVFYLSPVIYLAFIPAAIYSLVKGVAHARYYLIAWTLYNLALANWMLSLVGIYVFLPNQAFLINQIGFELQTMLLALALAHRIRILRNEKIEAQADNRAKSAFLARMSHEIRTPLSGILGMSELLADRLEDKTDQHYMNIIRSSGTSLLTIINDILDYSKFTSDNMELERIPFNIRRLAVDSLDVFKVKAAEKHVELIADINLDLPEYVEGDPTRVKQIMLNFISNAVKFTEQGQIVLRVDFVPNKPDMLKISVSDTGEGIDKDEQSRLFDTFAQANSATNRKHGGTGLGLSICKQLATIMGGEVGVESSAGKGATFWFTAVLPASAVETNDRVDEVSLKGLRILIVEDNYTFADLMRAQAKIWGMEPIVANNGRQALEKLKELDGNGLKVDLISLDLFMPIMDGLEFSQRLQQDFRFKNIPRLLLTSATNFPPRHQLAAAGIKKVAEKPTLPEDLLKIYKQLLAPDISAVSKPEELAKKDKEQIEPIKILVVEDNPVNQTVIQGILKRLNQNPEIVCDGEDAVELITVAGKAFDLVMMDCEMSRLDGLTATRMIRDWEKQQNIIPTTIVALTAHAVQEQKHACHEAGMNAYLTKPIEIDKLKNLLWEYVQHRQLNAFVTPSTAASGS